MSKTKTLSFMLLAVVLLTRCDVSASNGVPQKKEIVVDELEVIMTDSSTTTSQPEVTTIATTTSEACTTTTTALTTVASTTASETQTEVIQIEFETDELDSEVGRSTEDDYQETISAAETSYITDYERELLAQIVEHEAGSDWISCYDKACCVAAIMNRVREGCWGGSDIYSVLTCPGQFSGFYPGYCVARTGAYEAVDYYFAHPEEFSTTITSWTGDGVQNYFT